VPEGDTIYRAAHTLHRVLAGQPVVRFRSVYPQLTRVDADAPIAGRTVERVEARGKHLLMHFSGGLVLRTHMRMNGSWHVDPPGDRWQRPGHEMRIAIDTPVAIAVAFAVPVAEFLAADDLEREGPVSELGPDLLADAFDPADAVARLEARGDAEIADALLDQRALAGIGNVFKSEVLFAARVHPFTPVASLEPGTLPRIVQIAQRLLRANVADLREGATATWSGGRRTTGRADPSAGLWVYGRVGHPCRRCGTRIQRAKQGPDARSTYWCERCQPGASARR
jgi:endonuclease-8